MAAEFKNHNLVADASADGPAEGVVGDPSHEGLRAVVLLEAHECVGVLVCQDGLLVEDPTQALEQHARGGADDGAAGEEERALGVIVHDDERGLGLRMAGQVEQPLREVAVEGADTQVALAAAPRREGEGRAQHPSQESVHLVGNESVEEFGEGRGQTGTLRWRSGCRILRRRARPVRG